MNSTEPAKNRIVQMFNRIKPRAKVIDLRDTAPKPSFGQPQLCPECGGASHLDRIDVRNRVQYQHCFKNDHFFSTTEAKLAFPNADTAAQDSPTPTPTK